MASSSRHSFTKYLEDYNIETQNYVELMFLGCRLAKGLDLKAIMDYFAWVWRFSNKFIYDYVKEKL